MDLKARIVATGEEVLVYKHREGGYVLSSDMETRFTKDQIVLL